MRNYDEERELMRYVFRNYPEFVRPHECLPSTERIRDELPLGMCDTYMKHVTECRRIMEESYADSKRLSMELTPILPEMETELLTVFTRVFESLEKQAFWEKFTPYKDKAFIHRCERCQRILVNAKSQQCLWCGHDWH